MSTRPLPRLVAHADWSKDPKKRWLAIGNLVGSVYHLSAPNHAGDTASLLLRLSRQAVGSLIVGFDFPIGLPNAFAASAQISGFKDILPQLGTEKWATFYKVSNCRADISVTRPFYPYRPGGTSQAHLTKALGMRHIHDLLRICERRTATRGDACVLFWTLGPKQVGRGAIVGWREVLAPALKDSNLDVAVWPFDGTLDQLLRNRQCIVVETYPAEACLHLGMTPPGRAWSKRDQKDRTKQGCHLFKWAESRGVIIETDLEDKILDGFGTTVAGEDPFDAVLGLMSMIEVLLDRRSDGVPSIGHIRDIEGWIFGQAYEPDNLQDIAGPPVWGASKTSHANIESVGSRIGR
ncbi:MAG TPA: DUF429 domain-containing protein [Syntrophus sp. (in: bacteria)]|nr:DUF429 domain-containing protein [Syntrophus sp. (in: bacteria)]